MVINCNITKGMVLNKKKYILRKTSSELFISKSNGYHMQERYERVLVKYQTQSKETVISLRTLDMLFAFFKAKDYIFNIPTAP